MEGIEDNGHTVAEESYFSLTLSCLSPPSSRAPKSQHGPSRPLDKDFETGLHIPTTPGGFLVSWAQK
jgi:hypothetical protein